MAKLLFAAILTVSIGLAGLCFGAQADKNRVGRVDATVQTSMQSKGMLGRYGPELGVKGSRRGSFLSQRAPRLTDDFTVTLASPIHARRVVVVTGDDGGRNRLEAGVVEISEDGTTFKSIGSLTQGEASITVEGETVLAARVRPTAVQDHPVEIQKCDIEGDARIGKVTRAPRIVFDSSQADDLKEWGVQAQKIAQEQYWPVSTALASKDFIGPNYVRIWFNPDYKGVAATSNDTIEISPAYVRGHMDDFGMVVHELTHTIQHYTHDRGAGWLVEGIADYVRFYLYEPTVPRPRIDPAKSKYTDAYRTTAAFLAYGQEKYDHHLVNKLNKALREGTYSPMMFKEYTGKGAQEIWNELVADLQAGRTKIARL